MQREWPAHYLDGQTPTRYPATVRLMHEGMEVSTGGGGSRVWPYREIRQTQGFYEGEEVRLERGGQLPEIVIVADRGFLSSLHAATPETGRFRDPASRGGRIRIAMFAALAVLVVTAAYYFWGIPALAALAAPRVPVAWEESLGRSVAAQIAPPDQVCTDPPRQQALDAVLARLIGAARPSPYKFRVVVVDRPDVNALALPGGTIVVFRGLLEETTSPEALAGVLAHEIEHVLHHHTTRAIIQHTSTGLLLAALTGDMTGPLVYGLESARILGQLQYSRLAEEEADRQGMRLLLRAHVAPGPVIGLFEHLSHSDRRSLRYLSTHPSTGDRIATLKELAAKKATAAEPLLPGMDWNDIRAICAQHRIGQPAGRQ